MCRAILWWIVNTAPVDFCHKLLFNVRNFLSPDIHANSFDNQLVIAVLLAPVVNCYSLNIIYSKVGIILVTANIIVPKKVWLCTASYNASMNVYVTCCRCRPVGTMYSQNIELHSYTKQCTLFYCFDAGRIIYAQSNYKNWVDKMT